MPGRYHASGKPKPLHSVSVVEVRNIRVTERTLNLGSSVSRETRPSRRERAKLRDAGLRESRLEAERRKAGRVNDMTALVEDN